MMVTLLCVCACLCDYCCACDVCLCDDDACARARAQLLSARILQLEYFLIDRIDRFLFCVRSEPQIACVSLWFFVAWHVSHTLPVDISFDTCQ
jgi:hypothetical protein